MVQSHRDRGRDLELAQAAMNRRRKQRATEAKSEFRKWMEIHEPQLRAQVEAKSMSWEGLADWFWDQTDNKGKPLYRTKQGNKITSAMLQAAWTRIQAGRRMTELNYTMERPGRTDRPGVAGTARIGTAQPLSGTGANFELKTLGKPKKP